MEGDNPGFGWHGTCSGLRDVKQDSNAGYEALSDDELSPTDSHRFSSDELRDMSFVPRETSGLDESKIMSDLPMR